MKACITWLLLQLLGIDPQSFLVICFVDHQVFLQPICVPIGPFYISISLSCMFFDCKRSCVVSYANTTTKTAYVVKVRSKYLKVWSKNMTRAWGRIYKYVFRMYLWIWKLIANKMAELQQKLRIEELCWNSFAYVKWFWKLFDWEVYLLVLPSNLIYSVYILKRIMKSLRLCFVL